MAVETALVALRVYLHNSLYSEPLEKLQQGCRHQGGFGDLSPPQILRLAI